MRVLFPILILFLIPTLTLADSHVFQIQVSPENPDPGAPFRIYVSVTLPDQCWSQGPVGDLEFTDLDSYDGVPCPGGLFNYMIAFEMEGLPEGVHLLTLTEHHDSTRDPGPYRHLVEFTVGDPVVATESLSWGAIKSVYR